LEQCAGALAVLCLAIAALLVGKPSFSNASLPVRGIDDPVIAIQAARSITDVDWVLGNAPSPDREAMRIKQRLGIAFIGAYTALFLTLALLLLRAGGFGRVAGPAATICALATAGFNVAENLAVLRILDVPLYQTTAPMIGAIRSASFASWALAALTLALLSTYFLRSPRLIMRCVGALFVITAAMQLYGLRDNRFLVWEGGPAALALVGVAAALLLRRTRATAHVALFLLVGAGSLHAEVKQVRSYRTHEPSDRNVRFAMAVTPNQDVLSFVAKRDGTWRLTRVRNWLDKNPAEQTIAVPGIAVPERSNAERLNGLRAELFVTEDASFAICVATGIWSTRTADNVVSVIDLRSFQILTTVHQDGTSEHFVNRVGRFVLSAGVRQDPTTFEVTLRFLTLPDLVPDGSCRFSETIKGKIGEKRSFEMHDQDCGSERLDGLVAGDGVPWNRRMIHPDGCGDLPASGDALFRAEFCQTIRRGLLNPVVTDQHVTVLSTKTGSQIGIIKEATRDTVNSRFAQQDGRDYLLVMEGGTQLKVYEITEPHR